MRPLRCLLVLLILLLPTGPFATTFPVTKTEGTDDGICDPDCSLREAIDAANTNPGADDVPVPAGFYLLTLGRLIVSDDVSIAGAGQANTIIDGNANENVFVIGSGVPLAEISGVTIQHGETSVFGPPHTYGGGGVLNYGTITLTNSTVSGNTSFIVGGISSYGGTVTLTNSTVSGNTGTGVGGISGSGVTLTNTIVADNIAAANCSSPINSLGYNLTDDTSCGLTEPTDLVVADAMLGPLQDNGGPTETHDLLPGSPAIDAGSVDCPPPDTDQRGVARPQGADCDIGAVEYLPEPQDSVTLIAGATLLGLLYQRHARGLRIG